jgi:signal transduction histidine kinase
MPLPFPADVDAGNVGTVTASRNAALPYVGRRDIPSRQDRADTIMLRRMTQVALSGVVLAIAISGLAAGAIGDPDHGVTGELESGIVTHVVPGSPTWRDGIRPSQRVLELADAGAPGGWRIMTVDGEEVRGSSAAAHTEVLRLHVWWAIPALVFAAVVALLGFRQHRAAAALFPIALAIAAQPLFAVGRAEITSAGGAATFLGGGIAVAAHSPWGRRSSILLGAALALAAAWVGATLAAPGLFDAIDGLRWPAAFGFAVVGLAAVTDRRRLAEFLTDGNGAGFVDLAYLAATLGLAAALVTLAGIPVPLVLLASAVGLAVYPFWRRRTLGALERVLTAPARQDATIRAIEAERGRLAREIHDAPLQELAGVIRRLETVPGTKEEATVLRDVATHLRDVATALHPPVLQDLGLPAAIADHAEQLAVARPDRQINLSVDDLTGGQRPPADVELAAFRVVQEASANSLAHSSGRILGIEGAVSADAVELTIRDDGAGIDPAAARTARRNGHFGLDAMRERAHAVAAQCMVASDADGVTVTFRWERSG